MRNVHPDDPEAKVNELHGPEEWADAADKLLLEMRRYYRLQHNTFCVIDGTGKRPCSCGADDLERRADELIEAYKAA